MFDCSVFIAITYLFFALIADFAVLKQVWDSLHAIAPGRLQSLLAKHVFAWYDKTSQMVEFPKERCHYDITFRNHRQPLA